MLHTRCLRPMAAAAAWAPRAAVAVARASTSSAAGPPELPAMLQTKRDDYLLSFRSAAAQKAAMHNSAYVLAFGIPSALLLGAPVSTVVDLAAGIIIPLHAHMGMRGVLIDYVWEVPQQRLALALLAGVTVVTAVGLTSFNLFDVGLTGAIRNIYTRQPEPAAAAGAERHH